jgi:hypothetical protein
MTVFIEDLHHQRLGTKTVMIETESVFDRLADQRNLTRLSARNFIASFYEVSGRTFRGVPREEKQWAYLACK